MSEISPISREENQTSTFSLLRFSVISTKNKVTGGEGDFSKKKQSVWAIVIVIKTFIPFSLYICRSKRLSNRYSGCILYAFSVKKKKNAYFICLRTSSYKFLDASFPRGSVEGMQQPNNYAI